MLLSIYDWSKMIQHKKIDNSNPNLTNPIVLIIYLVLTHLFWIMLQIFCSTTVVPL